MSQTSCDFVSWAPSLLGAQVTTSCNEQDSSAHRMRTLQAQNGGAGGAGGNDEDSDDDVPDLVETFDEGA